MTEADFIRLGAEYRPVGSSCAALFLGPFRWYPYVGEVWLDTARDDYRIETEEKLRALCGLLGIPLETAE